MQLTKQTEADLVKTLKTNPVTVPRLQSAMNLGYREARSLVQYALCRGWLTEPERDGNEYKVSPALYRSSLSQTVLQRIATELCHDEHRLFFFIADHFSVRFSDILAELDPDADDMKAALDSLILSQLVIAIDGVYYCALSSRIVKRIKALKESDDLDTDNPLRNHFKRFCR